MIKRIGIEEKYHQMLKELSKQQKRTIQGTLEFLIEADYNKGKNS